MPALPPDPGWLGQEVGEVTVHWSAVIGGMASAVVVLGAVIGLGAWAYRRLRCWVIRTASSAKATAQAAERVERQTATSNGHTLGQVVESTAATAEHLRAMADANRTRIDALDARLDRHIIAGHRSSD